MSKFLKKFTWALWVKCFRCDVKFKYINLQYVMRIPEQMKYAAICGKCYDKQKGNARPISKILGLEYKHILKLP